MFILKTCYHHFVLYDLKLQCVDIAQERANSQPRSHRLMTNDFKVNREAHF